MQAIDGFPFGDTTVRVQAARIAHNLLAAATQCQTHGNLRAAIRIDPGTLEVHIDPTVETAHDATRDGDMVELVVVMDRLGGTGGVGDMARDLQPDAPKDVVGILVRYFEEFDALTQCLEDDGFVVVGEVMAGLERLQAELNADLGQ